MADEYEVRGGVGGRLPGAVGPRDLDGRAEWVPVRRPRDLLEALEARVGSDPDRHRILLAALSPLRSFLTGEPLGALAAALPPDVARELTDAELNLCSRAGRPIGATDYLLEVSRLVLHPPRVAAAYVRAVFAAAKAVLSPADGEAVAARLPREIAELWRGAR